MTASTPSPSRSPFDLTGRRALVTGVSRGLGLQMARALARAGADLVITARKLESLDESRRDLESFGHDVLPVALDVRVEDSIRTAVEAAAAAGVEIMAWSCEVKTGGVRIARPLPWRR